MGRQLFNHMCVSRPVRIVAGEQVALLRCLDGLKVFSNRHEVGLDLGRIASLGDVSLDNVEISGSPICTQSNQRTKQDDRRGKRNGTQSVSHEWQRPRSLSDTLVNTELHLSGAGFSPLLLEKSTGHKHVWILALGWLSA